MSYVYFGSCVSSTYEAISTMREAEAGEVSWEEFSRLCPDARDVLQELGAIWGETTDEDIEASDWISCWRSEHRGRPALYIAWSGYELIWEDHAR